MTMLKRIAATVFLGAAVMGAAHPVAAQEHPRVAFIPGIASDPFFRAMEVGARASAEKLGLELLWQGSSVDYSPQEQVPFVDAALANDIDALILVPTDPDSLQASVTKAQMQNIPVITVDTTVTDRSYLTSHITGDNVEGGRLAAETLARLIGGSGQVFVMAAGPAITTDILRRKGFTEALAKYPGIEVVDTQFANSQPAQATTAVNTALLNYPDLKGIFAINGTSTLGSVAALRNAGRVGKVALVGYDAYEAEVDALEEGVVTALVAQRPGDEAALALDYAKRAIAGDGVDGIERNVVISNVVITKENLEKNRRYVYAK